MNLIKNYLSKFYFIIDNVEIKKNFINIQARKTILVKNPYYEFLKNNPHLKKTLKKLSTNDRNLYKRNGREYNIILRKLKNSFRHHVDKIKFYENYNNKEKKFIDELNVNKRRYFIFKKILNSFLGLILLFKIRSVKIMNCCFFLIFLFYFGLVEELFSYLLDPKIESNLYEIDNFAYIPDRYNFQKLIREKAPENSLASQRKLGDAKKLEEFRESFEMKDEIKGYLEKKLLKFEKLKILIMGNQYSTKFKNHEPEDIFNHLERKNKYYFSSDYWKESFILRKIQDFYRANTCFSGNLRILFFGENSISYWIMKQLHLEEYYLYRHLTLNERIRYRLDRIKSFPRMKRLQSFLDEKYTPVFKKHLKFYILNFFDDKNFRADLFNWLSTFLFVQIEFRDFLLEKICMFLLDWLDSPGLDDMLFDLILRALNSESVRESIDNILIADPDDYERSSFEEKYYFEILDNLYSRQFRKYWINETAKNLTWKIQDMDNYFVVKNEPINMEDMDPYDIDSNFV